jgi:hypothetical protein
MISDRFSFEVRCEKSTPQWSRSMPAARTLFLKLSSVSRGSKLTLREALASDQLEDFVQQEEARGAELAKGSDLERALALLVTTRRRSDARSAHSTTRCGRD